MRNLAEILKHAADLGIWLFSQPSGFRFMWAAAGGKGGRDGGRGTLVVLPGLVKESDEYGKRLREGQVLVRATTVGGGGGGGEKG